jgi:MFS family permease
MQSPSSTKAAIPTTIGTSYRFVIGALILAAHLCMGLNSLPISPILPVIIEDYGITRTTASLLAALPLLLRAFVGLPGSAFVDRVGLKRMFALSWGLMGALAFSPVAPNFFTLLVLRLLFGLGTGFMILSAGPLIMEWFRPKEMAIVNSLDLVVMSLGMAIALALAAPLSAAIGWRGVLGSLGAIGLVGAVAWSVLGQTRDDGQEAKSVLTPRDIWDVLRDRTVFLLVVGDALVFIQYGALTNWLPTHLYEFRGMSLAQAGYMTGLLPFVGMFAVLLGGFLTVRVRARRLLFIVPGIMVGLGGFGSFLASNPAVIYASVICLGIGTWIYQPVLLTVPMQLPWMTPRKLPVVWGASLTIAGLGTFIAPIVIGASRDILGTFVPGFTIWAIGAWALLAAGILLPETSAGHSA